MGRSEEHTRTVTEGAKPATSLQPASKPPNQPTNQPTKDRKKEEREIPRLARGCQFQDWNSFSCFLRLLALFLVLLHLPGFLDS